MGTAAPEGPISSDAYRFELVRARMHMLFHGWFLPSRRSTFHLCSFLAPTQEPVSRIQLQRHHRRPLGSVTL